MSYRGSGVDTVEALQTFRRARRRASIAQVLARLSGQERPLLSYDEVRRKLRAVESPVNRLEEIPLDAIVGSVGRYNDFTREFLPKQDSDAQRWAGVRVAMTGMTGVPPIEVYRIGDAYFVRDGNHRVSVARQMGNSTIQAYVTPVHSRVPFTPDTDPSELIIAAEYAEFFERTGLDQMRPGADLSVTAPGQYEKLLEHIEVHRYYMGLDQQRDVDYPEAVVHWYDTVFVPVIESIRATGLLRGFEGRTETDLYLWLADHRARLEAETGWQLSPQAVAGGVAGDSRLSSERREQVLGSMVAGDEAPQGATALAGAVLVALSAGEGGWQAFEQSLIVAEHERSRLYGLHALALPAGTPPPPEALELRERFLARCAERGVEAQFAFAYGRPADAIIERAVWTDLVVVGLRHPPGQKLTARIGSGYLQLLRTSPRPLLAVPGRARPLRRALLAYDGGSRADEAMFAAAYIALAWGVRFAVVSVESGVELGRGAEAALGRARVYFERYGIEADYRLERGHVATAILQAADSHEADVVFMGSYRYNRWLESVLGGVLEEVMMNSSLPVMVV